MNRNLKREVCILLVSLFLVAVAIFFWMKRGAEIIAFKYGKYSNYLVDALA
ncbi:hypothetical protein P1X15_10755 [Runella sp. MFBS21]|uniref:hypothetical protein n=1 Tax=Runella sp. MFBS21 TaxID=3034018 RepID=UPI0023F89628|nr:hypothetical protein [Runella sp. MFBS21]MDF7818079.1 hypothetical protein [Runella sp. MFBS21]